MNTGMTERRSMTIWTKLFNHRQLILILLLAFLLRLFRIDNPVLDWHSFRQADTASVTREFVKHGINLLKPTYHDLSNIQSGQDNLAGLRMVEFPILNGLTAIIIKFLPFIDQVLIGRLISVGFSLISLTAVYFLVKDISGQKIGLWASLMMAVLPYSIYYSRVILPEPAMLACLLVSLLTFNRWLKVGRWQDYLISLIALIIGLLLKPYLIFMAPIYLSLGITQQGKAFFKNLPIYIYPFIAIAPLLLWRNWISQFPEGIPASDWLLNGNGIRFRPAWFRWIFYERLTKMFLGWTGLLFCLPVLFKPYKKPEILVYGAWWLGCLAFLSVFASGNVQHDYYQVLLLPIVSITLGVGIVRLINFLIPKIGSIKTKVLLSIFLSSSLFLAWGQIKGFFNVNHWEYQKAGQAVDQLIPADALVIAPAMGDTQFLFQTNRRGWPIGFEIQDKIKLGATYYVNTSQDDEVKMLESKYTIVIKTPDYIIIRLVEK